MFGEDLGDEIKEEDQRLQRLLKKHKSNAYLGKLRVIVGFKDHENYVKEMKPFGKKVLFCTGSGAIKKQKCLTIYPKLFKKYGFEIMHYSDIMPNPTLQEMLKGIDIVKKFKPDFIFALGGGSVIDTAKALSVGVYGDLWEFVQGKAEIKKAIHIIASSTTSGTGSQLTPYAVITNTKTIEKRTLKHPLLLPKIAITDLEIVKSMPKQVIASTGFDVLCHVIEVFTRNECTKLAAELSLESMKLIRKNLIGSYKGKSLKNKLGMIFGEIYAGMALALIGTHAPHAISHPISARFKQVSHGQALAYIFPETIKKQREKNSKDLNNKFELISETLGGNSDIVKTLEDYIKLLGLDNKPNFSEQDCNSILKDTLGYRKPSVERSPVPLSGEDVREIIYNSLR